jgi:4-hydroxybutyrate dehydrogenase
MGGIAFQKDLGATHSLAHPLSALHGLHHGTANAICLPHVMDFNAKRKPGLYRRIGVACGLDLFKLNDRGADAVTIDFMHSFLANLSLDQGLRSYGLDESHIDALVEQAYQDACHKTNPVPVTKKDLKQLYLAAL